MNRRKSTVVAATLLALLFMALLLGRVALNVPAEADLRQAFLAANSPEALTAILESRW